LAGLTIAGQQDSSHKDATATSAACEASIGIAHATTPPDPAFHGLVVAMDLTFTFAPCQESWTRRGEWLQLAVALTATGELVDGPGIEPDMATRRTGRVRSRLPVEHMSEKRGLAGDQIA